MSWGLRPSTVTLTRISPSFGDGMGRVVLLKGLPISWTTRAVCKCDISDGKVYVRLYDIRWKMV